MDFNRACRGVFRAYARNDRVFTQGVRRIFRCRRNDESGAENLRVIVRVESGGEIYMRVLLFRKAKGNVGYTHLSRSRGVYAVVSIRLILRCRIERGMVVGSVRASGGMRCGSGDFRRAQKM